MCSNLWVCGAERAATDNVPGLTVMPKIGILELSLGPKQLAYTFYPFQFGCSGQFNCSCRSMWVISLITVSGVVSPGRQSVFECVLCSDLGFYCRVEIEVWVEELLAPCRMWVSWYQKFPSGFMEPVFEKMTSKSWKRKNWCILFLTTIQLLLSNLDDTQVRYWR